MPTKWKNTKPGFLSTQRQETSFLSSWKGGGFFSELKLCVAQGFRKLWV